MNKFDEFGRKGFFNNIHLEGGKMKKWWILFSLLTVFSLSGCAGSSLFCDPRYEHCGESPKMQDEIADEVGQML
jgi:hypothetical protein